MQVFVGNPTLLHREFHYRVPKMKTARVLRIPAGGQAQMPEDLGGDDLRSVIEQLERYGAVPHDDIRAIVSPKAFIYRVDPSGPIKADMLEDGLERDEMARQELAGQKMEEAGLQAFDRAQKVAKGATVVETSMEIVEVNDRGKVDNGVNAEFVVSTKPERRAGRKRTESKT